MVVQMCENLWTRSCTLLKLWYISNFKSAVQNRDWICETSIHLVEEADWVLLCAQSTSTYVKFARLDTLCRTCSPTRPNCSMHITVKIRRFWVLRPWQQERYFKAFAVHSTLILTIDYREVLDLRSLHMRGALITSTERLWRLFSNCF